MLADEATCVHEPSALLAPGVTDVPGVLLGVVKFEKCQRKELIFFGSISGQCRSEFHPQSGIVGDRIGLAAGKCLREILRGAGQSVRPP